MCSLVRECFHLVKSLRTGSYGRRFVVTQGLQWSTFDTPQITLDECRKMLVEAGWTPPAPKEAAVD